jgi:hypothetical protein
LRAGDVSALRTVDAISPRHGGSAFGGSKTADAVACSRRCLGGERVLPPGRPCSDRRGGDDGEEYESACGEEGAVEAEGQRLVDWVMGGDEVVGPAGCDRRQDGESKRAADLLGCVDEA